MLDRRTTPFNGRVAHISLQGQLEAPAFSEGEWLDVALPLVDLQSAPDGPRDRQLPFGTGFCVIDRQGGNAYGFVEHSGYCGWLAQTCVGPKGPKSHWVASTGTHAYHAPKVQAANSAFLPMGTRLHVTGVMGTFLQCELGYVPQNHLKSLGQGYDDPVAVAEMFLGAPYLWGGNSWAGVDCSGLIQLSLNACLISCPGDSDQQQALGDPVASRDALRRGDLVFWKGHVAMMSGPQTLVHANAHTMSVANEDYQTCCARIEQQGGGPVVQIRRV
jgi:cell wall-associated NlpC family hydrolase